MRSEKQAFPHFAVLLAKSFLNGMRLRNLKFAATSSYNVREQQKEVTQTCLQNLGWMKWWKGEQKKSVFAFRSDSRSFRPFSLRNYERISAMEKGKKVREREKHPRHFA